MPTYPIVGAYFRPPAKALLAVLPAGARLQLTPEPDNEFDPNAIMVCVHSSEVPATQHNALRLHAAGQGFELEEVLREEFWHLGYIPRGLTAEVASKIDDDHIIEGRLRFAADGKPQVEFEL